MRRTTTDKRIRRMLALALALLLTAALLPGMAHAQEGGKTVRVGWYESAFNATDQFGRRSGYAYEYQRKIAAYTGWTYEYVEGSWPELMEMLQNGELDLLSDVSFTQERTEKMLFASLPMGSESYFIYTLNSNSNIRSESYASLNGKKIGVNRGSVQLDQFLAWEAQHGVQAEVIELTSSVEESTQMLLDGRLDAYISLDSFGDHKTVEPVWKIGSSDFYFAVSKDRPDLQLELDAAMNRIQDENRYYNLQLYEKYFSDAGTNRYLTAEERAWLSGHGTIRVGYQDNYLAFCATDPATGELTGALKDYLSSAATGFENAELHFEAVAYPTAAAALEAVINGEVDCMFPANLTDADGEAMGVVMTPPLMRTEMDAVVRASEQKEFIRKKEVVVAVNAGNTNYEMFLLDHYPGWKIAYFKDTPAGLEAIAAGKADCVIISNYRFNNISRQCEKLHLTNVYTGVDMDYCFALRAGETTLYSILARVTDTVPTATVNAALTYYSTEDVKTSVIDFLRDNLAIFTTAIAAIAIVIIFLLLRSIRAEKKVSEEELLVNDLNKRVYLDALTSVRNKGAFDDCVQELQDRIDRGEKLSFAIGVFDCDNLKHINDCFGHDKGDAYLIAASRLISRVFKHSPVFRIGGDEFAVVLLDEDYYNRETLIDRFRRARKKLCALAENQWDEVHVSMGVAVYDPQSDRNVNNTARRADRIMYENKRSTKRRDA